MRGRVPAAPSPPSAASPAEATAAGHDLAMALRAAYLTMHRRANTEFARFGLTADQFVLLTALAEGDLASQTELVRRTDSDANTISAMLRRLERRGLIARETDADDGRSRRVSLTEDGREAQRRAAEGIAAFRRRLAGLVAPDGLGALIGHLEGIADGLRGPATPRDGRPPADPG